MAIERVGIIGAGTMGNGIAHVFARRGFNVILCDVEQRFVDRGLDTIAKNLDREVAKNKIAAADKDATLGRITSVARSRATRRLRPRRRSSHREIRNQIRNLPRPRPHHAARSHPRLQHLFDLDHQNRRANQASRQSHRHALFQSRPGDEAGRSHSRPGHFPGHLRRRPRPRRRSLRKRPSKSTTPPASFPTASSCR